MERERERQTYLTVGASVQFDSWTERPSHPSAQLTAQHFPSPPSIVHTPRHLTPVYMYIHMYIYAKINDYMYITVVIVHLPHQEHCHQQQVAYVLPLKMKVHNLCSTTNTPLESSGFHLGFLSRGGGG